jgi:hypothetical protein
MSSKPCEICGDLNSRDVGWRHHQYGAWQEKASQCQSGGCKILLEAISKFFPEISSDYEVRLAPGNRLICMIARYHNVDIQLFVTEGMRSTSQLTL